MSGDVKVDLTGAIKKTKTLQNLPKATKYQLTAWGSEFVRYLKQTAVKGRYVGKYKGGVRSGQLRRGIKKKVIVTGDAYKLEVGTQGVKYARILEKGGTITPKRKQYLTIPLKGVKGRARDYPGAFVIKSKKGNLLIVQRRAKKYKGSMLKPLFVLKKQVKIPRFAWLEKSLRDRKGKLDNMLGKARLYKTAEKM